MYRPSSDPALDNPVLLVNNRTVNVKPALNPVWLEGVALFGVRSQLHTNTRGIGDNEKAFFNPKRLLNNFALWRLGQSPELWKLYARVFQIQKCLPWDE